VPVFPQVQHTAELDCSRRGQIIDRLRTVKSNTARPKVAGAGAPPGWPQGRSDGGTEASAGSRNVVPPGTGCCGLNWEFKL